MDETDAQSGSRWRTWLKRIGVVVGVLLLVLVLFHRPILQTVVRRAAIYFAAKQNLKLETRVEGSILGGIVLRNVHVSATGPSALQSADVDVVNVDYSLVGLLRHGMSDFLKNVEVRNASAILDPSKAPPVPPPKPNQKFSLPAFFPDRLVLADVNLRMASTPNDLVVQHLNLELLPNSPGELRIAKLQLASGRAWTDVTAQTTYENRNLFLRNLVLDKGTQLAAVNIDASKIGQNKLDVAVKGTVAGGKVDTTLSLGAKDGAAETDINLNVEETSIDAVRKYLEPAEAAQKRDATSAIAGAAAAAGGAEPTKTEAAAALIPPGIDGDVRKLSIKVAGQADKPSSWNGTIAAQIDNLVANGVTFDHATIDVKAADGRAQVNDVELNRGANKIALHGTAELPDTFAGFGHRPATIQLRGELPDLAGITAGFPQPITGSAEVNGQVKVANDTVSADISLAGGPLDFGQGTAQKFVVKLNATKAMPPPNEQRPYYDGLTSDVSFDVTDLRAKGYVVDAVQGRVQNTGPQLNIEELLVRRAENNVALSGTYQLPADFAQAAAQPAVIDFSLAVPHLGAFWAGDALATGSIEGTGRVHYQEQIGDGYFNIYGSNIQAQNLTVHELSVQGTTANNVVYLNDLTARLNAHDSINAHGQVTARAPYAYGGALAVNIANLSTFEPVLKAAGKETPLAGSLAVNWQGRGVGARFDDAGGLRLKVENGRFGNLTNLKADVDASYTPEALNVPLLFFASDKLLVQADARTHDGHLEVSNIQIVQDKAKYANGYVSIPFEWTNLGTEKPLFPTDGKLQVNLQTENLDLQKLAKDLGASAPVTGLANLKVDANGTINDLHAAVDLQLTGLRSEQLKDFTPATFGLNARIENKELVIAGKLEQARIEPVQINAKMPLDVAKIIENKKLNEDTPVQASVRMPRSSINFAREFVPAIDHIDGNLALDVNVGGTIAKPSLSGAADATINVARMSSGSVPPLSNFNARLTFDGDRLSFQQFAGELSGGKFSVGGAITFPKLTNPTFDLTLRADSALVARNEDMMVRADANVSVVGPLTSATVSGNVLLTNSQFLKNLDLIPIGTPGRPPPAPQPPSDTPDLAFPNPPLRDWKFDLAIKTKDPFRIRGNLAHGGALVDMRLTGTGAAPKVDGSVRLQNVEATLPFSRLEIQQGFLYFNPTDPLNPNIDIQGTSLIKNYTVRVYVYGTANQPQAVFTSEPPLPQEDIIALLATGVTREELMNGGNVLAGRALMLLGQQLYHKVFRKGESSQQPNNMFENLDLDVGNVDPRTGQQTATARYRVNEHWQVIGDIGVQGDFRGTVRYLIRFR